MDLGILLAALGITLLEMTEAAAVGLALYGESQRSSVFLAVALGTTSVLVPTAVVGRLISLLPAFYIRLVAGVLLLYFGVRLLRSARRSYRRKLHPTKNEEKEIFEHSLLVTAFSVGAVEAFEAAIVLVALIPVSFYSSLYGLIGGVALVVVFTYILRSQVRKVKQASMKVVVSALLLSFATLWFLEEFITINDVILLPLFAFYALAVRQLALWHLQTPKMEKTTDP